MTASLPSRPPNISRIVELNRRAFGQSPPEPATLDLADLGELVAVGATLLDGRSPAEFDVGHLAGAVNLPVASAGFGTRAGWALDPELPLVIIARDHGAISATASALQAVGFWTLSGAVIADPAAWGSAGMTVLESRAWDLDELALALQADAVELVDVREQGEWIDGHVVGSHHFPLNRLRDIDSVPIPEDGRTVAVACAGGVRAAFAASILRRAGRHDVVRVAGGGVPDLSRHGIRLTLGA